MSNVLIGIIGVILFIGLALAGALILGDDFRSASSSSKAAAVTSQLQQGVQAVNMYQLKTGRVLDAGEWNASGQSILVPRFLKTMPVNPTGAAPFFAQARGGSTTSGPMYILVAPMPRDSTGKAICLAIAEAAGTTPGDGFTAMQSGGVGCAYSSADPLHWVAYVNVF